MGFCLLEYIIFEDKFWMLGRREYLATVMFGYSIFTGWVILLSHLPKQLDWYAKHEGLIIFSKSLFMSFYRWCFKFHIKIYFFPRWLVYGLTYPQHESQVLCISSNGHEYLYPQISGHLINISAYSRCD